MNILLSIGLFITFSMVCIIAWGQPANDNCSGAQQICFDQPQTGSSSNASADPWASTCHSTNNTIWYKFTTNKQGGNVSVNVNSTCVTGAEVSGTLLAAPTGCNAADFIEIDCNSGTQDSLTFNGSALDPETTYYIVLNSQSAGQAASCDFTINVTGPGVAYSAYSEIQNVICYQKLGSVKIDSVNMGPGPYTYTMNHQTPQNGNNFTELNVGAYTVTITDGVGCSYDENFFINGLENNLSVDAGQDKTIIAGGSVQLYADGNGESYLWDPYNSLNNASSQSPIVSPGATTTYAAYTYSPELCQAVDHVTVLVLPRIIIPNAFTPNGDGVNDTWQIHFIEQYPNSEIDIYNRWGQKVFKSKMGYEKSQEWEGKSMGVDLPASTYYYTIDLNANTDDRAAELYRGSVTIIR